MIDRGREAPAEYYERPEIEPHLNWLRSAFWELSTERQLGMTIGPIPGSKIREYLRDELDLYGAEYDRARAIIRKVDNAYMAMLTSRKDDGPEMADTAKTTDSEGVRRVVRGLGNRYKMAKPRRAT